MSDLSERFEQAAKDVKQLSDRPSNEDLLELYALFKQGSVGDVTGKRPGITKFKDRAKYDAWKSKKGMASEDAMQAYIDVVERLQKG